MVGGASRAPDGDIITGGGTNGGSGDLRDNWFWRREGRGRKRRRGTEVEGGRKGGRGDIIKKGEQGRRKKDGRGDDGGREGRERGVMINLCFHSQVFIFTYPYAYRV